MDNTLKHKIKAKMQVQISGLIDENMDAIIKDLETSLLRADSDKPFKFPVSFRSIIFPIKDCAIVESSIAFSTKTTDETEKEEVSLHPELPMGEGDTDA